MELWIVRRGSIAAEANSDALHLATFVFSRGILQNARAGDWRSAFCPHLKVESFSGKIFKSLKMNVLCR
jgi:hypothetical protein